MSDMRHVYNAYAAVHNPEIKKNLEESRDAFSKMNLNQLMDQDLYEASEEILEKVFFHHDLDIPTAESLIEAILSDALEGDKSPIRTEKIERISEAFASAFDRIKEKSIRVAKESYTDYLYKKDQLSRITSNSNLDLPKQRLHTSLVAEDRKIIKSGILEIIEGKINAGLQAYLDKKKGKKTDDKKENGKEENGNGKSSKGGKPDFLDLDKDGDKKESMKKAAKDKKMNEGIEDILARLEKKRISKGGNPDESPLGKKTGRAMKAKQDQIRKDAGMKEAYTVTNADKKGNTPAYQGYKAGKKNKLTGKPLYKAADHMKEDLELVERLLESGKFSGKEIANIANIQEADIADILARLEKKRISKGGDPDQSPFGKKTGRAMKAKQDQVRSQAGM